MSKQTKDAKHFDVDVKVRDFCSKSKLFFIIGFALILISLLSTFTGVDVALEFKGGTIITYSYTGDVDESSIVGSSGEEKNSAGDGEKGADSSSAGASPAGADARQGA